MPQSPWKFTPGNSNRKPFSINCPNCRRLVSTNSERCIHCGLPFPGKIGTAPLIGELLREQISFIDPIVIFCFILFGLALVLDPGGIFGNISSGSTGLFNLLSPSTGALYQLGMGGAIPWRQGGWWTLLTGTYLHGGLLHIAFNMMWLKRIGPWIEAEFGHSRFLVIYTAAGLAGGALTTALGTPLWVGASGAVFGLFGALVYYGKARGGIYGSGIFRQVMIWAAFGFIFGLVYPGVDNWGHLGGFIGGFGAAWLLKYQERRAQNLVDHSAAIGVLLILVLSFGAMLVNIILR